MDPDTDSATPERCQRRRSLIRRCRLVPRVTRVPVPPELRRRLLRSTLKACSPASGARDRTSTSRGQGDKVLTRDTEREALLGSKVMLGYREGSVTGMDEGARTARHPEAYTVTIHKEALVRHTGAAPRARAGGESSAENLSKRRQSRLNPSSIRPARTPASKIQFVSKFEVHSELDTAYSKFDTEYPKSDTVYTKSTDVPVVSESLSGSARSTKSAVRLCGPIARARGRKRLAGSRREDVEPETARSARPKRHQGDWAGTLDGGTVSCGGTVCTVSGKSSSECLCSDCRTSKDSSFVDSTAQPCSVPIRTDSQVGPVLSELTTDFDLSSSPTATSTDNSYGGVIRRDGSGAGSCPRQKSDLLEETDFGGLKIEYPAPLDAPAEGDAASGQAEAAGADEV